MQFVDEINNLLEIPKNLTDLGVVNPDIATLVEGALKDPSVGGNPIEMTHDNTMALLKACL